MHGGVITTMLDLAAYLTVLPSLGRSEQAVTRARAVGLAANAPHGCLRNSATAWPQMQGVV
jgi:acyl-coenzyme A thioesterase PaaI-like protein